ncbi:MAG: hypothetical protein HY321_06730 [Armatimonadetes bacterium]|nr:hypothetical protein [Armatimonadota bacterium]
MEWPRQLGNLASTMARIASRAGSPQYDELVTASLREAMLFIEWSAPRVPPDLLLELAGVQRELRVWRRLWPLEPARPLLALYARNRSDRLLQMAGMQPRAPRAGAANVEREDAREVET